MTPRGTLPGNTTWMQFDWTQVTTVVPTNLNGFANSRSSIDWQLICHAHAHGARVVAFAPGGTQGAGGAVPTDFQMPLSANLTLRRQWVTAAVELVRELALDGLNFDFESPLNATDPRVGHYAAVIAETRDALQQVHPRALKVNILRLAHGWCT